MRYFWLAPQYMFLWRKQKISDIRSTTNVDTFLVGKNVLSSRDLWLDNNYSGQPRTSPCNVQCRKKALMQFAENAGPDQTKHLGRLIRPLLPANRINGYCSICQWTENVKIRLHAAHLDLHCSRIFQQCAWCLSYDAQHTKRVLIHFCRLRRSRSACTSVQSNLYIFCSLTYTTVSTDFISGQQTPRSACAYVQADQGLPYPLIS